jgi:Fe-S-cluster containining protein
MPGGNQDPHPVPLPEYQARGKCYDLADMTELADSLKVSVSAASMRPEVRKEIHVLYADLQLEIDRRRPLCVMSGRCCRFDEYGHRLYVTTAELAAFMADLAELEPAPVGPGGGPGGCRFQTGKICRVHLIRPMGCRLFFCDPTATEWQQAVYERFHARLKKLHEELSIPYSYVEWRFACRTMGWQL